MVRSSFHFFFAHNHNKKIRLSSIIEEGKKSTIQVNKIDDKEGTIPFFTSGEAILKVKKPLVNGFHIYLSTGGNANVKSYFGKASYSTDTWCISAKEKMNYFFYEYLKLIESQLDVLFFHGTGLKHLQKPLFINQEISAPSQKLDLFNSIAEPVFIEIGKIIKNTSVLEKKKERLLSLLINGQLI